MAETSINFEDGELQEKFRKAIEKIACSKSRRHADVRPLKRMRTSSETTGTRNQGSDQTFDSKVYKILEIAEPVQGQILEAISQVEHPHNSYMLTFHIGSALVFFLKTNSAHFWML